PRPGDLRTRAALQRGGEAGRREGGNVSRQSSAAVARPALLLFGLLLLAGLLPAGQELLGVFPAEAAQGALRQPATQRLLAEERLPRPQLRHRDGRPGSDRGVPLPAHLPARRGRVGKREVTPRATLGFLCWKHGHANLALQHPRRAVWSGLLRGVANASGPGSVVPGRPGLAEGHGPVGAGVDRPRTIPHLRSRAGT